MRRGFVWLILFKVIRCIGPQADSEERIGSKLIYEAPLVILQRVSCNDFSTQSAGPSRTSTVIRSAPTLEDMDLSYRLI